MPWTISIRAGDLVLPCRRRGLPRDGNLVVRRHERRQRTDVFSRSQSNAHSDADTTPTPTPSPTDTGIIKVSNNRLMRDDAPWVPHAVQMVAFVAPPSKQTVEFAAAYQHYLLARKDEFKAMAAWGADSVRIQLSQPGADPGNNTQLYNAEFVANFYEAVREAREAGLTVIISIQDEPQSGEPTPADLPDCVTQAIWAKLAHDLKGDNGIVFEIFNEPHLTPTPENWLKWAEAMNQVVTIIRDAKATNTLIADGLNGAETLDGVIPLTDWLGQVAYSSHPYFHNDEDQDPKTWDRKFGNAAATLPVIVGEWTTQTKNDDNNYYCAPSTPPAALKFLQYLQAHNIGLVAVAYDFALPKLGGIVTDFNGTPTTYANGIQCGDDGFGPGKLVQAWYLTGNVPRTLQ